MTTVGNATFSGPNVEGEHLVLDIGGNLTVESLQDKMDSSSKSSGFGLSLSNINPSTLVKNPTSSLSYWLLSKMKCRRHEICLVDQYLTA
ncbi:hypothetical protein M2092_002201 [Fusobacterium sp. PH5-44]